ncbi:MAG: stalk domain-containing protein [Armatimonadota bacterium]
MYYPRIAVITGLFSLLLIPCLCHAATMIETTEAGEAQAFTIVPEVPDILVFEGGKMVPAAPVVRAVGGEMTYNKGQVTITLGETTLRCKVGKSTMEVVQGRDKRTIHLTLAPFELNGEVYLPLLSMVTALEGLASYNANIPGYIVTLGDTVLRLRENVIKVKPADYREREPQVYLAALDGSELTRLTYSEGPNGLPAISPAGNILVFSRYGALYLRKADQSEAELLLPANNDEVERTYSAPCFAPDGKTVLFTKYERKADEIRGTETVGTCALDETDETPADSITALLAPRKSAVGIGVLLNTPRDGVARLRGGASQGFTEGMVLFLVRRGIVTGLIKMTQVNPVDSAAEVLADLRGMAPGDRAIISDRFFARTTGDGKAAPFRTVLVHPVLGAIHYAPLFPLEGSGAVLSPSGLTVAWTANQVGNPVIKVANLVTQEAKVLATGHSSAFSPDGKRIAFIDGNGGLMLIDADGKNASTLQASWQGGLSHPAFTPNGAEVLFLKNGTLCAIKPGAGARGARELTKGVVVRDYAVCPDGKHLLLTAVPGKP